MITKENMSCGEGDIIVGDSEIESRKRTSQSEEMASKEGMSQNVRMRSSCKRIYSPCLRW